LLRARGLGLAPRHGHGRAGAGADVEVEVGVAICAINVAREFRDGGRFARRGRGRGAAPDPLDTLSQATPWLSIINPPEI
jgi:hypothetical protein